MAKALLIEIMKLRLYSLKLTVKGKLPISQLKVGTSLKNYHFGCCVSV